MRLVNRDVFDGGCLPTTHIPLFYGSRRHSGSCLLNRKDLDYKARIIHERVWRHCEVGCTAGRTAADCRMRIDSLLSSL